LLGVFNCWEYLIVALSLAKSTMATIAYCGIVLLWVISIGIVCWVIFS
jgi:hypothetical protein